MRRDATSRRFLAVGLLVVGGILLVSSPFLPWGHHRNHWSIAKEDFEAVGLLLEEMLSGEAEEEPLVPLFDDDSPIESADLEEERDLEEVSLDGEKSEPPLAELFYFSSRVPALLSPAVLGSILILVGVAGRSRLTGAASGMLHIGVIVSFAGALWSALSISDQPGRKTLLLIAATLVSLLLVAEGFLVLRSLAGNGGRSRSVHVLPLLLFLLVAIGMTVLQWGNDQWHVVDYILIAAGSALGLAGVAIDPYFRWAARSFKT